MCICIYIYMSCGSTTHSFVWLYKNANASKGLMGVTFTISIHNPITISLPCAIYRYVYIYPIAIFNFSRTACISCTCVPRTMGKINLGVGLKRPCVTRGVKQPPLFFETRVCIVN